MSGPYFITIVGTVEDVAAIQRLLSPLMPVSECRGLGDIENRALDETTGLEPFAVTMRDGTPDAPLVMDQPYVVAYWVSPNVMTDARVFYAADLYQSGLSYLVRRAKKLLYDRVYNRTRRK